MSVVGISKIKIEKMNEIKNMSSVAETYFWLEAFKFPLCFFLRLRLIIR